MEEFQLYREDCQYFKRETAPDSDDGYFGQGDYHLMIGCDKGLMNFVPLPSNYEPGQKGCPQNCPEYRIAPHLMGKGNE
jgi:hypothetical protein